MTPQERATAALKNELDDFYNQQRLAEFMACRDARYILDDGEIEDVIDLLMYGNHRDPYAKWSKEELVKELCEQYDSLTEFQESYKVFGD